MSRIAAAIAFACTIVLVSDPSYARARFRMPSSTPRPAAVMAKPAAAAPAPVRNNNSGLFIAVGSRPAATPSDASAQRAVNDPANGPLQFNPTLASADAKPSTSTDDKAPAPLKELAAAPASECVVAKEPAPAKEKEAAAAKEPATVEPVQSRAAFLVPVASKHKPAAAPQVATVCYVQRDGSCTPY